MEPSTRRAAQQEPTDSDVDLRAARRGRRRGRRRRGESAVMAAVAAGGAIGAAGRYLVALALPAGSGAFPTATFVVNVLGCGLIGILMVLVTDVWIRQRLLRPFLGTGVLGGFTTFSTYTVDVQRLASTGHLAVAAGYLAATLAGALAAVWLTTTLTRRVVMWRMS